MSVATPLRSIVEATRLERIPGDYVPQYGFADHHADDHYRPRRGFSSSTDRAHAAEPRPARLLESTPLETRTAPAVEAGHELTPASPGFAGRRAYSGWQLGVLGEQPVAEELDRLIALDPRWSYLNAIPVGADCDIDHLLVGPGGVFTIDARHHHACSVWVGEDGLLVNGTWKHYVRDSRHEAERASELLSAAAHAGITAKGLVVPVGIADLTVKAQPADVQVVDGARLVDFLVGRPTVLDAYAIALVLTCARLSTTWRPGANAARA